MSQHKNQRLEKDFTNETGEKLTAVTESKNELQSLTEGIDSSVMEKVSEAAGENKSAGIKQSSKKQSKGFDVLNISGRIKNLLPKKSKKKEVVLPEKDVQVKMVEKSLKAKQKELMAQADKIVRSKKFSASKLENVISQVRYIQSLLQELVNAAGKTIEKLYKKFVLKAE